MTFLAASCGDIMIKSSFVERPALRMRAMARSLRTGCAALRKDPRGGSEFVTNDFEAAKFVPNQRQRNALTLICD